MQTNISAVWPLDGLCETASDALIHASDALIHANILEPRRPDLERLQSMMAALSIEVGYTLDFPPLCWRAAEYLIEILREPFETSESVCLFFLLHMAL